MRQGNCTDPYAGLNIRWTSTKAVCSNGSFPDQLMKTSYKDFAPRLGIAYSPDSKTVVRAGAGIFYNQEIGNAMFDMARNIAARVTLNSTTGTPNLFYSNAVPGGSGAIAQIPPPYAFADAYDHHTTYAMQYLLNIQRQFRRDWLVEAGYLGGLSRHLQGFQDANQGDRPERPAAAPSRFPFSNFGVIQLVADGGNGELQFAQPARSHGGSARASASSVPTPSPNRSTTPAASACRASTLCSRRTAIACAASAGCRPSTSATAS